MEEVRLNKKQLISKLSKKLFDHMKNKKPISIHLYTGRTIMRMSVTPDIIGDIDVDENSFYIEVGLFCFNIENGIDHIEYSNEEGNDSYYIRIDDLNKTEMFLDFV